MNTTQRLKTRSKFVAISKEMMEWNCQKQLWKLLMVTFWIGNRLRRHFRQLCTIAKVSLTLKNLHTRKHILTNQLCKQIEGFPLTSENYTEAWNLLNYRYGNEQYIIDCHMKKLVKLEPVIHPGVKDLRKLYDTVESHVQSLNSLGINCQHFDPLLIPIILERLPNTIKLQISCNLGKENWNIEQFLLVIHEEISARENFEYFKQSDFDKKKLNNQFTTSSLHT